MTKARKLSEKATIANAPALCGEPGIGMGHRLYLCVGPHTWGRSHTAADAVKNAKANRTKIYEGKAGWRWVLYDVQSDATIDEMGSIVYVPIDGSPHEPYFEIARYNLPEPS